MRRIKKTGELTGTTDRCRFAEYNSESGLLSGLWWLEACTHSTLLRYIKNIWVRPVLILYPVRLITTVSSGV